MHVSCSYDPAGAKKPTISGSKEMLLLWKVFEHNEEKSSTREIEGDFLIFVMVYKSLTALLHLGEFHRNHFHVEPFVD